MVIHWGYETHPPPNCGRAAETETPQTSWSCAGTLSNSVRSCCRNKVCLSWEHTVQEGPHMVFPVLAPLDSIQAEKRSRFFCLFCWLLSIHLCV